MSYQRFGLLEFVKKFSTQADCVDALVAHRWPQGCKCSKCGGVLFSRLRSRRALQCRNQACRRQISVTAGTVLEGIKIPLPKVFLAIYLMTSKQGISAQALSKDIDVNYNTAFYLLHKLRSAMASRDSSHSLSGLVQMDESYLGGHTNKKHRAGRARTSKVVVGVAVEQRGPNQSGFIHLEVIPSASSESLHGMILGKIKRGSHLQTDAWSGYRGIEAKGYLHTRTKSPGGLAASKKWPLVHRAVSNLSSWMVGTHRQFCMTHLSAYLGEYCWRTNRRNRSKHDYKTNAREATLPDRLLTLAVQQPYIPTDKIKLRRAA